MPLKMELEVGLEPTKLTRWFTKPFLLPLRDSSTITVGVGLEPTTSELTAPCSTIELPYNKNLLKIIKYLTYIYIILKFYAIFKVLIRSKIAKNWKRLLKSFGFFLRKDTVAFRCFPLTLRNTRIGSRLVY